MLEDLFQWGSAQILELYATYGLTVQEWDKARTDWLNFHEPAPASQVQ